MTDSEWTIFDDEAIQKAQEALEGDRHGYGQARHYNQRRAELLAALENEAPEVRWMVKTAQEREVDEMMGRIPKGRPWGEYQINAIREPGESAAGPEKLHGKIEISAEHVEEIGVREVARVIAGLVKIQWQHAERVATARSSEETALLHGPPPFHPNARCAPVAESALRTWLHRPQPRRRRWSRMRIPSSLLGGACLIAGLVGGDWGPRDGRWIDGLLILAGTALLMFAASLRKD